MLPITAKRARRLIATTGVVGIGLSIPCLTAGTASAAPVSTWDKVAQCESSGDWSINTGNGFYGGLQFTESTWLAYGGGAYAQYANQATRAQQIAIAEKVLAGQGIGAWPVCGPKGYTSGGSYTTTNANGSGSSSSSTTHSSTTTTKSSTSTAPKTTAPKTAAPKTTYTPRHASTPSTTTPVASTGKSYTVVSGDTLSKIASAHGTTWQSLYNENKSVVGSNANLIFPGQVLHF